MTFMTWLALAGVCITGAMAPGPSLALILRYSLRDGRRNGALAALTHGTTIGLYAACVLAGLGALINTSPIIYNILQYGGALYLLWLAYHALRSPGAHFSIAQQQQTPWWKPVRDAAAIACLNPKIAMFFLALFSQFITPDESWLTHLTMVLTVGGVDVIWYLLVACVLVNTPLLTGLRQHPRRLDQISGVVLLLVALMVLVR